jgi:predicted DNA-binding transcriptional regulator AlpA|tara:strand:- start:376 stop:570 length:195 start_codon:yes stop_codon:yes gene_type:complete
MEKLLKPQEVIEVLSISESTLYQWSSQNKFLTPVKVGGANRYRESDIQNIINGGGVQKDGGNHD